MLIFQPNLSKFAMKQFAWSNSDVCDGWLCKGDDCEEAM